MTRKNKQRKVNRAMRRAERFAKKLQLHDFGQWCECNECMNEEEK